MTRVTYERALLDRSTGALNVIDYAHHEIHGGNMYTCHYSNECTNTDEMSIVAFNTGDSPKWCHMFFAAGGTALSHMAIYESPSLTAGAGTQLAVYNRERNSTNTSLVTSIEATPVVNKATSFDETEAAAASLTTTTELMRVYMGSGEKKAAFGGLTRGEVELVLKQDTQYAFVVTSVDDNTNFHSITMNWYEHTERSWHG